MIYICQKLTVFSLGKPIWQRFTNVPCVRSYHRDKIADSDSERTGSRSIPEVKRCRARILGTLRSDDGKL